VSGSGEKFGWAKKHYERIIVVIVLFVVIGSALFLALRYQQDYAELALQTNAGLQHSSKQNVQPLETSVWDAKQAMRDNPLQVAVKTNRMNISELRVRCANEECQLPIPYDAAVCPFCETEQPKDGASMDSDGDRIPDDLEIEYNLDPYDPTDASSDLDNDGFTALEEFDINNKRWISSPLDNDANPPPESKIRLVKYKATPFKMQFKGVQDLTDGERYQLNMGGKSKFARMNEVIRIKTRKHGIEEYTVTGYEKKSARKKNGIKVDVSVLTIESNGKKFKLVKNRPINKENKTALLIFLLTKKPIKAKIGNIIELKGYQYKVIDIDRNNVLLEDVATGKRTDVQRITEEEISVIRNASQEKQKTR